MTHWLDDVVKLLESESNDFRELALLVKGDPRTFYRGTRITMSDQQGQDMTGMEFEKSDEDDDLDPSDYDYDFSITAQLNLLMRSREWREALTILERESINGTISAELYRIWIKILKKLRMVDEAVNVFERMRRDVVLTPQDYSVYSGLYPPGTHARIGVLEYGVGENPESIYLIAKLANELAASGNESRAEEYFSDLISFRSRNHAAWLSYADYLVKQERLEHAEKILRTSLSHLQGKSVQVIRKLGEVLIRLGRFDEAEYMLKDSISKDPNNRGLLFDLARVAAYKGDIDGALAMVLPLTEHYPAEIGVWKNIGAIAFDGGDRFKAQAIFDEAKRRFPDAEFIDNWLDHLESSRQSKMVGAG
jgi:pentatricopeptide repeat protein